MSTALRLFILSLSLLFPATSHGAPTKESVLIKYSNVGQLLTVSSANRRIEESKNADAISIRNHALEIYAQSHEAIKSADWVMAEQLLNLSANHIFRAVRLVGAGNTTLETQKERYTSLRASVLALKDALIRTASEQGKTESIGEVLKEVENTIKHTDAKAADSKFSDAYNALTSAYQLLRNNIYAFKSGQTVTAHEKIFSTPQEEFKWELDRFDSYYGLLSLVIAKRKISEDDWTYKQLQESSTLRAAAVEQFNQNDILKALSNIKNETTRLIHVLRKLGLSV